MEKQVVSGILLIQLVASILGFAYNFRSVKAESEYYSIQINVVQGSPPADDNVNVTVTLFMGHDFPVTFGSLSQIGNDFLVYIDIYVPEVALPIVVEKTETYHLGELSAGSYNFAAFVTVSGYGSDFDGYYESFAVRTTHIYPGQSIQEAINSAQPGDTIFVHTGIYYLDVGMPVVVNKTVSLAGEDRSTTVVDGNYSTPIFHVTADNVTISGFTIQNGGRIYGFEGGGIYITNSTCNRIIDNVITDTQYGINLEESANNIIVGNEITENDVGIQFLDGYSCNNTIYHNNFIDNTIRHHDGIGGNTWDDGYPSGGNFWWPVHNPPEVYSGPYQNETGRDKIGDIPYIIDGNNSDRYPLIYPYGYVPTIDLNNDGIIGIIDIVIIALAFGSRPGDIHWNPYADINQDGIVDIQDIVILAIHFGETWS